MTLFYTLHGKAPCDDIGGTVKGLANLARLQSQFNNQITTLFDLYERDKSNFTYIHVYYCNLEEYHSKEISYFR